MNTEYKVGDTIRYRAFGGEVRKIRIDYRTDDIKDNRAGFDGTMIDTGMGVWGYDEQIIQVIKEAP